MNRCTKHGIPNCRNCARRWVPTPDEMQQLNQAWEQEERRAILALWEVVILEHWWRLPSP